MASQLQPEPRTIPKKVALILKLLQALSPKTVCQRKRTLVFYYFRYCLQTGYFQKGSKYKVMSFCLLCLSGVLLKPTKNPTKHLGCHPSGCCARPSMSTGSRLSVACVPKTATCTARGSAGSAAAASSRESLRLVFGQK